MQQSLYSNRDVYSWDNSDKLHQNMDKFEHKCIVLLLPVILDTLMQCKQYSTVVFSIASISYCNISIYWYDVYQNKSVPFKYT